MTPSPRRRRPSFDRALLNAEKGVAAPDSSNSLGTSSVNRAAVLEAVKTVSFSVETETSTAALWGVATDRSLTID